MAPWFLFSLIANDGHSYDSTCNLEACRKVELITLFNDMKPSKYCRESSSKRVKQTQTLKLPSRHS